MLRVETGEERWRRSIQREETALRGFLFKVAAADAAIEYRPRMPDALREVTPSSSRSASIASSASMSSSMSFSNSSTGSFAHNSAIFNAVASADAADLDEVLEQLRARHSKVAKRLRQYNKVPNMRSLQGHAEESLLLQHEEEGRGDIALVEEAWRKKIVAVALLEPWMDRAAVSRIEENRRALIVQREATDRGRLIHEFFDMGLAAGPCQLNTSGPHEFVPVKRPIRIDRDGNEVSLVDSPALEFLLHAALNRLEKEKRAATVGLEWSARMQLAEEMRLRHQIILQHTSGAPPPVVAAARAFDGKVVQPPTQERTQYVRGLLCDRKGVLRDHSVLAECIIASEREARKPIDYHYQNTIRFQLSLPTSTTGGNM
jgi:hypothetical protein